MFQINVTSTSVCVVRIIMVAKADVTATGYFCSCFQAEESKCQSFFYRMWVYNHKGYHYTSPRLLLRDGARAEAWGWGLVSRGVKMCA